MITPNSGLYVGFPRKSLKSFRNPRKIQCSIAVFYIRAFLHCLNSSNCQLVFAGDLDRNTMAVIANAIHFKAMWKKKFEPSRTNDMDFHGINGITQVKMMHQTGHFNYGQVNSIQAQLLELPYEVRKKFTLVVNRKFLQTETRRFGQRYKIYCKHRSFLLGY